MIPYQKIPEFFFCRLVVVTVLSVLVCNGDSVACGQEVESSDFEQPLPDHAVWRFGEIGTTEPNGYYELQYSPNGEFLAAAKRNNVVEVRNVTSRKLICVLGAQDSSFRSKNRLLDFSPDSKFLLTASDENVVVWNVRSGRLTKEFSCNPIHAVFSESGRSIFVLDKQQLVEYSWPEARLLGRTPHAANLESGSKSDIQMKVSRNGRFVVARQKVNNERVVLTKLVDMKHNSTVILDGPRETPQSVAISNDNNWVAATYNEKNSVRLWNVNDPSELKYELIDHNQSVNTVSFSSDNRFLVSAGWDKRAVIWELLTREKIGVLNGHDEHVNATAFAPLSLRLATGASGFNDCTVIEWSTEKLLFPNTPRKIQAIKFDAAWNGMGNSNPITAFGFVNDLRNSVDQTIALLESRLRQPMRTSQDEIYCWIRELDSASFATREKATLKLIEARGPAERLLIDAFDNAKSTEVMYRISRILKHSVSRPQINVAELRRLHRSVFLLELISQQPDLADVSIELLDSISQNHPHIDVARDAMSALRRISFRQANVNDD